MEVKNLGIPCYNPISLKLYVLTLSCAYSKSKQISKEKEIRHETYDRCTKKLDTKSVGKYKEALQKITFYSNERSIGEFGLNSDGLKRNALSKIIPFKLLLNTEGINNYFNNVYDELKDIDTKLKNGTCTKLELMDMQHKYLYLFQDKPSDITTRAFLDNELEFYKELFTYLSNNNVDISDLMDYYIDGLNPDKLALFLAYTYLLKAKKIVKIDKELAQYYLFYVTGYIYSRPSKDSKFISGTKEYTYKDLFEIYKSLIKDEELQNLIMDRDVFIDKDLNDNKKVIDSLINMEKIYVDEKFVKNGTNGDKKDVLERHITPVTDEELEFIRRYLNERYYAYLINNPVARIDCIDYFNNYVAFLFENGNITADRFKHINRASECNKDAIYLFDIFNFDELIKLNKEQLRGISKRIMHTDGWQDKVSKVAKENKEVDKVLIKKFVKNHE